MTDAPTTYTRAIPVPPIYRAMVLEVERRRLAVGISMDRMSELMGTAERSYAKMLYPDTSSGRMVQWNTLQAALDVLFCDGYDLRLNPIRVVPSTPGTKHESIRTAEGTKRLIKHEAATWDRRIRREVMAEIGSKGGKASIGSLSKDEQRALAAKANRIRWARVREQLAAKAQEQVAVA